MALLVNDRIRLRALEPEDLSLLYRWENDSDLWSVGSSVAPYSQYVLREYIAESRRDIYEIKQLRLMIEVIDGNRPIGLIDLFDFDPHNRRAGIGILLDPSFRGNGWAADALSLLTDYAFSFLKLHQLYANVPLFNKKSMNLFSRNGFKEAGRLTDWLITGEGYEDVLVLQKVNGSSR